MKTERAISNSTVIQKTEVENPRRLSEYEKKIENHRAAAAHLEAGAIHHREAARHYTIGDYEKAHQSAFYAQGHHNMAADYLKEDAYSL
ncbi:MAG: hypothetical protein ACT4ON_00210 [Bacteroidota bacterium]